MKYRNLGRSGLKVSEVSLGSWMTFGGVVDDPAALACIQRAYELGINFFDTANVYNHCAAVMGFAVRLEKRFGFARFYPQKRTRLL